MCGGLKVVVAWRPDVSELDELQELEELESLEFSHGAAGTSGIERKLDELALVLPFGLVDQDVIESLNCIPLVRLRPPHPPLSPAAGSRLRLTQHCPMAHRQASGSMRPSSSFGMRPSASVAFSEHFQCRAPTCLQERQS